MKKFFSEVKEDLRFLAKGYCVCIIGSFVAISSVMLVLSLFRLICGCGD